MKEGFLQTHRVGKLRRESALLMLPRLSGWQKKKFIISVQEKVITAHSVTYGQRGDERSHTVINP